MLYGGYYGRDRYLAVSQLASLRRVLAAGSQLLGLALTHDLQVASLSPLCSQLSPPLTFREAGTGGGLD